MNLSDYSETKGMIQCPMCGFSPHPGCSGVMHVIIERPVAFVLRGGGWAKDGYSGSKK